MVHYGMGSEAISRLPVSLPPLHLSFLYQLCIKTWTFFFNFENHLRYSGFTPATTVIVYREEASLHCQLHILWYDLQAWGDMVAGSLLAFAVIEKKVLKPRAHLCAGLYVLCFYCCGID